MTNLKVEYKNILKNDPVVSKVIEETDTLVGKYFPELTADVKQPVEYINKKWQASKQERFEIYISESE